MIFQYELQELMSLFCNYSAALSSDDLFDSTLPLVKSRANGGTMVMWHKSLDSFITLHPPPSASILPIILRLPDRQVSIHIAIYLPTSGKDMEFATKNWFPF